MTTGSIWNPENIRDVAESIGIQSLSAEVEDHLTRDVEFRIAQVLEEALKFMRHAKRTILFTQDISQALRALDIEPLYGYESTRPLRFGEASIGPGQPLYYLEDEEVDFEKLINAPLPKVPRDMTFTAHWLAVEGVQPSIPQNPSPADSSARNAELLPKGPSAPSAAAANLAVATAGADNLAVKPLVKHVLSKELQLYFEHVCAAMLDESNEEYQAAALTSLRTDPGLHQLVPYFIQFVAEKVTHNLKNIFILKQMMSLTAALLPNPHLHLAPYISALIPPVLTCLVGKRLGVSTQTMSLNGNDPTAMPLLPAHYSLRTLASSVLSALTSQTYTSSSPTLKPRLARSLLHYLLSPTSSSASQPLGTYYGAVLGLNNIAGAEGVRTLLLPNLAGGLDESLKEALEDAKSAEGEVNEEYMMRERVRRREIDAVVEAVVAGLEKIEAERLPSLKAMNGTSGGMDIDSAAPGSEDEKRRLLSLLGEVVGDRVWTHGKRSLIEAVLAEETVTSLS